jgi:2-amino-4-hydroxy-6-hydroxymethyldihydropteridine diphosphokinase
MQVLLGLGGNLGDPPVTFHQALAALDRRHTVVACSSLYRTEPVGPPQPRYWNMAALVQTTAGLRQLLDECHEIEAAAGRERAVHWGPRTLDLDLLLCESIVVRTTRLTVPHPELHRRAFALVPAAELVGRWRHPLLGESIAALADRVGRSGVVVASDAEGSRARVASVAQTRSRPIGVAVS